MFRHIYDWFTDPDNGGIRRFYIIIGIGIASIFIYTNYFRVNDYDKIDAERKQAIERNIQLASEKAVLENELGHIEVQVKLLTEKLENNQQIDEEEQEIIASMSVSDKLQYLARAGYIRTSSSNISDSTNTR